MVPVDVCELVCVCLGFDELQFKDFKEFNCVQQPPPVVIMECVCVGKKTLFFIIHCFFYTTDSWFPVSSGLEEQAKEDGTCQTRSYRRGLG